MSASSASSVSHRAISWAWTVWELRFPAAAHNAHHQAPPLTLQAVQRIQQIKELIEDSESKVKDGTLVVPKSGTALEDIFASVGSLTNLTGQISVASDKQAEGIEQINQALVNLDGTTQQNTSMVEAAAATSDAMSDQAEQLNRQIGYFSVA